MKSFLTKEEQGIVATIRNCQANFREGLLKANRLMKRFPDLELNELVGDIPSIQDRLEDLREKVETEGVTQ